MERYISISLNYDDEKLMADIRNCCLKEGFTPKIMKKDALDIDFIRKSEVLFGFYPREVLKEAKALQWFHCSFAGVDQFSDPALYDHEITLTNSKGAYGLSISEHMIGVLLIMMRRFKEHMDNQNAHKWLSLEDIDSIYGSGVCVIGCGDIGSSFIKKIKPMGAYIKAVRRNKNAPTPFADEVFSQEEIDEAIKDSDVVAMSLPSTKETAGIMTRERIFSMKKGAYLINVGRGTAIDEDALFDALREGHLKGAALDVFAKEPLEEGSPVWDVPNLIITPHIAGNTMLPKSRENVTEIFLDNFSKYVKGERLSNIVDMKKGY